MTFKSIVKSMIETAAKRWLCSLLDENGIEYLYTVFYGTSIEKDDPFNGYMWDVKIRVALDGRGNSVDLTVGGTVDDLCGICCSCIHNESGEIVWMSVPETREELGITEFKIA